MKISVLSFLFLLQLVEVKAQLHHSTDSSLHRIAVIDYVYENGRQIFKTKKDTAENHIDYSTTDNCISFEQSSFEEHFYYLVTIDGNTYPYTIYRYCTAGFQHCKIKCDPAEIILKDDKKSHRTIVILKSSPKIKYYFKYFNSVGIIPTTK